MSATTLQSDPTEDRGPMLRSVTIGQTVLSVVVVAARLFVRAKVIRTIGLDDWLMAFTTVLAVVGMALVAVEVEYGAGRHVGDLSAEDFKKGLRLNYATQLVYLYGICFAKLAVGASLYRIAAKRFWKVIILSLMIFVFLYTTAGFVTILIQCTDIRANWDQSIAATCWSPHQVQIASHINFGLNILTDLIFALLIPICMLWKVNMPWQTKISLFFVLGLGCFVSACAIIRTTYLGSYGKMGDWLWDTVDLATWSVVELNVGILAGSLPSLRPLARRFLGSVYGTGSRGRKYYGGSSTAANRWAALTSARGKGGGGGGLGGVEEAAGHVHQGRDLPLDDASSLMYLHERSSPPGSADKSSFELPVYGVEAHVTSGRVTSAVHKFPVGITKTTHTTVSYDDTPSV